VAEEAKETTETTTVETKAEKAYAQADVDAITEKVRAKLQKQVDELTTKLTGLQTKNESEAEKQLREQHDALETAKREALEQGMKMGDLRGYLRSLLPKDAKPETVQNLAAQVNALAGEWADPTEAVKAFEAQTGLSLTAKRVIGGINGRNAETEAVKYDDEGVTNALRGKGPMEQIKWWTEHKDKVEEYQTRERGTTITTIAPGQGLTLTQSDDHRTTRR